MSVLIKGMEMPEYKGNGTIPDLHKAAFKVYSDGSVDLVLMEGKEHFQITEVPTPHGRLIDADLVITCLNEARKKHEKTDDIVTAAIDTFIAILKDMYSLVEGEE